MTVKKREFLDKQGKKQIRYRVNIYNKYTGKTQWIGTYTNKKDADASFDEAKRKIRIGELPRERKDIGLGDLVDRWLATLTVRRNTKDDYKYTTTIVRSYFKNRPVSEIDREAVQLYIVWCIRRGYSDAYVRKLKARLSQVLYVAMEWGYLSSNPAAGFFKALPKPPKSKIAPLEAEAVRKLIEATPPYHRALFLAFVSTGLRRGEAFGLTWDDVDLDRGEITVNRQLIGKTLEDPKSDAAVRTIPLPAATLEALRVRRSECPTTALNLVFTTERGMRLNSSNFYKRVWVPIKEAASLPSGTTLHQLRKTFASACARQGRTPAWLAEVMGHEKASTTLAFYTAVLKSERDDAMKDMDDWLALESENPTSVGCGSLMTEGSTDYSCSTAIA